MQNNVKPKIAIIGSKGFPAFGGAARANYELIARLKNSFDITIYTISTHHSIDYITEGFRIKNIKGLKSKRLNTLYYYLYSTFHSLLKSNYDLVHLNHLYSGYFVPLLKIRYKALLTAHGIIPEDDDKWNLLDKSFFRFFEKLALKFSDHIVSVSRPHIELFKQRTNRPISYIPNGAEIPSGFRTKNNEDSYLLFSAARIIRLKGCHIFLEALNIIGYKGKVMIIGDTEQVGSYNVLIKKLSSSLNLEFTGLIKEKDQLYNYLAGAKYFIFPSFNEGLSNMLLEVASLSTPIIASDIVENKAVFNEDEVLFFNSGDSNDLAKKISWALQNDIEMKKKAELALEKVKSDYNWDKISDQYTKLYEELISH